METTTWRSPDSNLGPLWVGWWYCFPVYSESDCMYDVSLGFFKCYISVGFGTLMEVGDVELGLDGLYYLHIPVWYTYGLTCDQVVHPVIDGEKKEW